MNKTQANYKSLTQTSDAFTKNNNNFIIDDVVVTSYHSQHQHPHRQHHHQPKYINEGNAAKIEQELSKVGVVQQRHHPNRPNRHHNEKSSEWKSIRAFERYRLLKNDVDTIEYNPEEHLLLERVLNKWEKLSYNRSNTNNTEGISTDNAIGEITNDCKQCSQIVVPIWNLPLWNDLIKSRELTSTDTDHHLQTINKREIVKKYFDSMRNIFERDARVYVKNTFQDPKSASGNRSAGSRYSSYESSILLSSDRNYTDYMNCLRSSKTKVTLKNLAMVVLCALGALMDNQSETAVLLLCESIIINCAILPWTNDLTSMERLFSESLIVLYQENPNLINLWVSDKTKLGCPPQTFFLWISSSVSKVHRDLESGYQALKTSFQWAILFNFINSLFFKDGSRGLRKVIMNLPSFPRNILDVTYNRNLIPFKMEDGVFVRALSHDKYYIKVLKMISPESLFANIFTEREIKYLGLFRQLIKFSMSSDKSTPLNDCVQKIYACIFLLLRSLPSSWPEVVCERSLANDDRTDSLTCVCLQCLGLQSQATISLLLLDRDREDEWKALGDEEAGAFLTLLLFGLFRTVLWVEYGRNQKKDDQTNLKTDRTDDSLMVGKENVISVLRRWKKLANDLAPSVLKCLSTAYWGSCILGVIHGDGRNYPLIHTFTRLPMSVVKQFCLSVVCNTCGKMHLGSSGLRLCGGCKLNSYCDVKCHDTCWIIGHRRTCGVLSEAVNITEEITQNSGTNIKNRQRAGYNL